MVRFDWEEAVAQDLDLQRIDAFVKLTISKFPGQPTPRADTNRGSRYEPAAPSVKAEQPSTGTLTFRCQFVICDHQFASASSYNDCYIQTNVYARQRYHRRINATIY